MSPILRPPEYYDDVFEDPVKIFPESLYHDFYHQKTTGWKRIFYYLGLLMVVISEISEWVFISIVGYVSSRILIGGITTIECYIVGLYSIILFMGVMITETMKESYAHE